MDSDARGERERLYAPVGEAEDICVVNRSTEIDHGLTAFTAALFIVGEIAGSGVLALPNAVANAGWIGAILIIVLGILSGCCGIVLSRSWLILRRNFREYQEHVRYPYPAIGFHAYGKFGKRVVLVCINATLIGACTVFLLLASENLHHLIDLRLKAVSSESEYRIWLVICSTAILPLTWLGTPKNFWPVALFAIIATSVACLLIVIKIGVDFDGIAEDRVVTTSSFFSAFGAIAFAFGGTAAFPTIQCDMKVPGLFSSSIVMASLVILAMYLPVSILGFLSFGEDTQANVLKNLSATSGITKCVTALITAHLLFSFIIVINPVSQLFEEWLNVPQGIVTVKGCIVRTVLVQFIHALAQGIPHFGLFLNLVGSSTTTLLTFVFPCLFYLKLEENIPLHFKAFLFEIVVVALLAASTSTYFAVKAIIDTLS